MKMETFQRKDAMKGESLEQRKRIKKVIYESIIHNHYGQNRIQPL